MDSLPLSPGQVVSGRYRIDRALAIGGFAVVYAATRLEDAQPVALKALKAQAGYKDESAVKRLEREAQVAQELSHPHSVRVFDSGESEDGSFYYVMELLDGVSVEGAIRSGHHFSAAVVKAMLEQILGAIEEMHGKGLVHRDLKPANIYLCQTPDDSVHAKLLDFGFAKVLEPAEPEEAGSNLTRKGIILGTPGYLAPEVCEGGSITGQADLYALGIIAYEMLSGAPAYFGKASEKVRQQMTANPPELAPELHALRIAAVIEKLMARKPVRRYETARLALIDLESMGDPAGARQIKARWWQFW